MDLSDDTGSGLVASIAGMAVFVLFLLFAAQVLLYLQTASTVRAVAFDAASASAGVDATGAGTGGDVVATARALLGGVGRDAQIDVIATADVVRVRVSVPGPRLVPAPLARQLGVDVVQGTATVRTERFRGDTVAGGGR